MKDGQKFQKGAKDLKKMVWDPPIWKEGKGSDEFKVTPWLIPMSYMSNRMLRRVIVDDIGLSEDQRRTIFESSEGTS